MSIAPGQLAEARDPHPRDTDFVQSLARGLAVIRAFGPDRDRLGLGKIAAATGLSKSVARRYLRTLGRLGYVEADGREYRLRPRVLELGYGRMSGLGLGDVAAPHVAQLAARLQESSAVAVLCGQRIEYVVRAPARRPMAVAISAGTRLPAYPTALGRVLLAAVPAAELDYYLAETKFDRLTSRTTTAPGELRAEIMKVARRGYAIVDQELDEGLRAVAVPVRGRAGAVIAAVNVSAHASRMSLTAIRSQFLPALLDTAAEMEADLTALRLSGGELAANATWARRARPRGSAD
jgi:IclR family transcriptional regulator, pca regulon regulatory protein